MLYPLSYEGLRASLPVLAGMPAHRGHAEGTGLGRHSAGSCSQARPQGVEVRETVSFLEREGTTMTGHEA